MSRSTIRLSHGLRRRLRAERERSVIYPDQQSNELQHVITTQTPICQGAMITFKEWTADGWLHFGQKTLKNKKRKRKKKHTPHSDRCSTKCLSVCGELRISVCPSSTNHTHTAPTLTPLCWCGVHGTHDGDAAAAAAARNTDDVWWRMETETETETSHVQNPSPSVEQQRAIFESSKDRLESICPQATNTWVHKCLKSQDKNRDASGKEEVDLFTARNKVLFPQILSHLTFYMNL